MPKSRWVLVAFLGFCVPWVGVEIRNLVYNVHKIRALVSLPSFLVLLQHKGKMCESCGEISDGLLYDRNKIIYGPELVWKYSVALLKIV